MPFLVMPALGRVERKLESLRVEFPAACRERLTEVLTSYPAPWGGVVDLSDNLPIRLAQVKPLRILGQSRMFTPMNYAISGQLLPKHLKHRQRSAVSLPPLAREPTGARDR